MCLDWKSYDYFDVSVGGMMKFMVFAVELCTCSIFGVKSANLIGAGLLISCDSRIYRLLILP